MTLIDKINKYLILLKNWGIHDLKLGNWETNMMETYLNKFSQPA